ncbi:MAG: hypothetical protein JNJ54_19750 [Myxococcaceae bacterium]|nr:hypothetical protein [Myxococcaceae bacterium]
MKLITLVAIGVVFFALTVPWAVTTFGEGAPWPVALGSSVVGLGVPVALLVVLLLAPRAVRLESDAVVVERLGWRDYRIPLADIASVEAGPLLKVLGGGVWRVAGNGGLMGFTGYFFVRGLGVVRCWATRLGPTVLVRRKSERPALLGVDDGPALLDALARRLSPA